MAADTLAHDAMVMIDLRLLAMSRMSLLSSPLLLGFDEIERLIDRVGKSAGDGPYGGYYKPPFSAYGEKVGGGFGDL